jgi:phosphonate transport system ATP-binding protein
MTRDNVLPLLTARGLGLRLDGRWLFRNLDFSLLPHEFLALTGPSGVGKSSLLSCLAGTREPTEGEIVRNFPTDKGIGIVFQDLLLADGASVLTNTLCGRLNRYGFARTLWGFPEQDRTDAFNTLQELGIANLAHKWAAETSRGEQQRVAIARALLQEPALFLADEPVASLDFARADAALNIFQREAREHGRPVFAALHDPRQVGQFADRELKLSANCPEDWTLQSVSRHAL